MGNLTTEQKVERLWDVHQIKNLMGRYALYHNANEHMKTVELFDLDREDCWLECGGMGVYKGPEGIRKFFYDWHLSLAGDGKGALNMHTLTSDVIEVAEDGQTAYAVWVSPGIETRRSEPNGDMVAMWIWGKYGVDFIKDKNGDWKFWHFTITLDFLTDYDHSWVETENGKGVTVRNDGVPANDGPNTFEDDGYRLDKVWGMNPRMPIPYESYDKK